MKNALLAILVLCNFAHAKINTKWKEIKQVDGIIVSKGKVKGSKIVAFKGQAEIKANFKSVLAVLVDMKHKTEWVDRLIESKNLEQLTKTSRVEYSLTKTPWPLNNRDFVYKAQIFFDKKKQIAKILINSVKHKDAPERDGVIRGELRETTYILKSISNGLSTDFTVEVLADPKGWVPKWVVNLVQRKWPIKTINGIRAQVEKPYFTSTKSVRKILKVTK